MKSLYFIQEGYNGPIKIGLTKQNLAYRVAHMQCGNYRRLQVLGIIENQDKHDERNWHRRYADVRVGGEWFAPTVALLTEIIKKSVAPKPHAVSSVSQRKLQDRDRIDRAGWVSPEARNLLNQSRSGVS